MDAKAIEAALKSIEDGVAAIRGEITKEDGAGQGVPPAGLGAPGSMATPAAGSSGPASGGMAAFLGR